MAAARYDCELFGLVHYSQELSYEALYEIEERFIQRMQEALESQQAEHLDFWGTGDALQFQCALARFTDETLRILCDEAAECLIKGVSVKIVCIDKHLTRIGVYRIVPGAWGVESLDIADAPDASDARLKQAPRQGDSSPSEL